MEDVNLSFLNKVICAVTVRSSFHSLVQTPDKITELLTNAKLSEIPCYNNLEYIDVPISYTSFVAKYMFANLPCVLKKWATADWPACRLWTQIEGKKVIPDFCEFKKLCPEIVVPVANCRKKEFNSHSKEDMQMKDYIDYFVTNRKSVCSPPQPCLYLKDWHFFRDFPHENVYNVPKYFLSDWLNEVSSNNLPLFEDDFRFVYIGPKNSWTPFHADVFHSFSWSANVCGRKKWLLFPPGSESRLKDRNGHLPFDASDCDVSLENGPIEVVQEAGEVIFVPSGWHHQVHNMEDTISINHNWFNGCNLHIVWNFLQLELSDVENEIDDCRELMSSEEWTDQCQLLMKANTGMNLHGFYSLLKTIADMRLLSVRERLTDYYPNTNILCEFQPVSEKCFSSLSTLKSLCCKCDFEPSISVPYEVCDICFLIPVLLDMSQYYDRKHLCAQLDFFQILCKCCSVLDAFSARLASIL